MNRIFSYLALLVLAVGGVAFGQETEPADHAQAALDAISSANITAAEQHFSSIKDPVAKLYVMACIAQANGKPEDASRMLGQLIVRYPNNEQWTARSELKNAEIYLEMGLLDAADVTARQIQNLYAGTDVAKKAGALRSEIEKLKENAE